MAWSSGRVMVTGGAGFLGQAVVARLRRSGASEIFVPRHADYDLRTPEAVRRALADARPEVVIHLAGVLGGIGANRENPGRFFFDNAIMGIVLLEEARLAGVQKFVTIGTTSSYPKLTRAPFREDDFWNGYPHETKAPYGMAKKILLVQGQAYRQQYGFNAIYLILVNLYGPGDDFNPATSHVIPALIAKCVDARNSGAAEIELWGSGLASREFLYVHDAAEGIVLAAERYDAPEPVNLGVGRELTIKELATLIAYETRFTGTVRWNSLHPEGQSRNAVDTTRALERFGFAAHTPLEVGLRHTVEWYEAQRALASVPRGHSES